jgi:hypothetical protein
MILLSPRPSSVYTLLRKRSLMRSIQSQGYFAHMQSYFPYIYLQAFTLIESNAAIYQRGQWR